MGAGIISLTTLTRPTGDWPKLPKGSLWKPNEDKTMDYQELKEFLADLEPADAIAALEDGELLGKLGVTQEGAEVLHSELNEGER